MFRIGGRFTIRVRVRVGFWALECTLLELGLGLR